jgi:hypothetical protein
MSTHRFLVRAKEGVKRVREEICTRRSISLAGISEKTPVLTYGKARAFLPDEDKTGQTVICIDVNSGVRADWVTDKLEENFGITLTPVNPVGKRYLHR